MFIIHGENSLYAIDSSSGAVVREFLGGFFILTAIAVRYTDRAAPRIFVRFFRAADAFMEILLGVDLIYWQTLK